MNLIDKGSSNLQDLFGFIHGNNRSYLHYTAHRKREAIHEVL